jgi:dTDP-4-dehydrorhamnose 3,5-epimerase
MTVKETKLKGCFILTPDIFDDHRGYFFESYSKSKFETKIGHEVRFVQDNQSFSKYGVIRALHYQIGIHAQAKLVRVLHGKVLDIAVDLREQSETFGEHISIELSAENKKQLFIPRGFAHGFATLSESADFFYKCDNQYNAASEGGIIYNDATLNIDWKIPLSEHIVSEKDLQLPSFKNVRL